MSGRNDTRICIACNEDGFGPSAFGYYIARALMESWDSIGTKLRLAVLNRSASKDEKDFNPQIYAGRSVDIRPLDSLVRLPKPQGEVHVPEALELLGRYADTRSPYSDAVQGLLEGCDVAIDVGVPLFARAAKRFGVPHRLTVFDHSWAATLRLITSTEWQHVYRANPAPRPADREAAEKIATWIQEDEACATEVFLFEDYITPREFVRHWERLGLAPRILPGVLGSRVTPGEARAKLDSTLAEYGQAAAPRNRPLILLSPGGTPVWDEQLPKLLEQVLDARDKNYVLVLSKDLGPVLQSRRDLGKRVLSSENVRYYGPVRGSTQQGILPAFQRIVTRAGGGTVNDALAAGVRFACVEEPQVQVLLIERECRRLGITGASATLEEFRIDPLRCIDRLVRMDLPASHVAASPGAERAVVDYVRDAIVAR